jgi:hypothetical protein
MHRTVNRRPDPTPDRSRARWAWFVALWCALAVAACAGGSGSSGFGALLRENRAIDKALETQGCEMNEGLIICASGAESPTPTPTETMQPPLDSPTQTPSPTGTPGPLGTATATTTIPQPSLTATAAETTATPTTTPTFTPIPSQPSVDTNIEPDDTIPCELVGADGPCFFVFTFQPQGLPSAASYRVAVRTRNPEGDWLVLPVVDNSAVIEIDTSPSGPDYQIAVLAFTEEPPFVPETVELLADTGADYAFVTPVLTPEIL